MILFWIYRFRRGVGHPWLFMLALGTAVAALVDGAVAVCLLMLAACVWLVRHG